ncbi:hypothetical protein FCV25MIE_03808 [Fagus crenata]
MHGFGKRYRCEQCYVDLHQDCMFIVIKNSTFKFHEQTPSNATIYIATIAKDIATHVGNTSKVSSTIARKLTRICTLIVATSRMNLKLMMKFRLRANGVKVFMVQSDKD